MDITHHPIYKDVLKVINAQLQQTNRDISITLHTPTANIEIINLGNLDIHTDYVGCMTDLIFLKVLISSTDYARHIYPNRNNLEATMTISALGSIGNKQVGAKNLYSRRYKALFLVNDNEQIGLAQANMVKQSALDIIPPVDLNLQLSNRAAEALDYMTLNHDVFQNIDNEQLLKYVYASSSASVSINGKPLIDIIDIVTPDNTTKRDIVIPHGTHVTAMTYLAQHKFGGVYNAGIGSYVYTNQDGKNVWSVYPKYNTNRFNQQIKKLVIYVLPTDRFAGIEKTFRVSGDTVYIVCTGNKKYFDDAEAGYGIGGVGFMMTNANSIHTKGVEVKPSGPYANPARINYNVATLNKADGNPHIPMAANNVSSNPYVQYSEVLARTGGNLLLEWDNGDAMLLHPCMPCNIVFFNEQSVDVVDGVLHGVDTTYGSMGFGVWNKIYKPHIVLHVFSKKNLKNRI